MKNKTTLFTHAVIHTGLTQNDTRCAMLVTEGRISRLFSEEREISVYWKENHLDPYIPRVDLKGQHVYPCLIDAHQHVMMTIASMALGFSVCEFSASGVTPDTLEGVAEKLRERAASLPPDAVLYCQNYVASAMDVRRLPTRHELDAWCGGRPVLVYNIDGHSTALSTAMMEKLGMDPEGHDGILSGEENEKAQGPILEFATSALTPSLLARGLAAWQNRCAACGISVVCALEGNGTSPKDPGTPILVQLARRADVGVRLYLQYTDPDRVKPYRRYLSRLRVGGCGDWEMDGSVGSHSAAFLSPYRDTGETAPCYYSQEEADRLIRTWSDLGYQVSGHAIGECAVERLLSALEKTQDQRMHRIEHGEFMNDHTFRRMVPEKLTSSDTAEGHEYAVVMQPGYSWIDRRYLHSYERHLPEGFSSGMKLRSLYEAGICVCGSSDSPIQDMDPWLQITGMVRFYRPEESLTPFQAFRCFTANAARAIEEAEDRGTLEEGRIADFFTAGEDLFRLTPEKILDFRPTGTWYAGEKYKEKTGSLGELAKLLGRKPHKI